MNSRSRAERDALRARVVRLVGEARTRDDIRSALAGSDFVFHDYGKDRNGVAVWVIPHGSTQSLKVRLPRAEQPQQQPRWQPRGVPKDDVLLDDGITREEE